MTHIFLCVVEGRGGGVAESFIPRRLATSAYNSCDVDAPERSA